MNELNTPRFREVTLALLKAELIDSGFKTEYVDKIKMDSVNSFIDGILSMEELGDFLLKLNSWESEYKANLCTHSFD